MIFSSLTKSSSISSYRRDFLDDSKTINDLNVEIEGVYKENTELNNENLAKPFDQINEKVNTVIDELSKRNLI